MMKDEILALAEETWVDKVGFAPVSRFNKDDPIFKIMPEAKTVICLVFELPRGIFRGVEEGTTYYQYTTMAVENMEETVMPMAQIRISNLIESYGYTALPQRRHQQIMKELNSTNPEVAYDAIYRGVNEPQLDFLNTAVLCGVGEKGLNGALLTKEFGPLNRYCFILTDAEIEPTPLAEYKLCDGCKECVKACPGSAISQNGEIDPWQCAVYYNGANGLKNPFMNPDAFADFDDRLDVIAGKKRVTPDSARKILDKIYFYPPAQHAYQCSICGRACYTACYSHLEEKGLLGKKYNSPYRKRTPWSFDLDDFKI